MKRVTYILTVAAVMLAVTALADESRLMPYLDYGKMNATIDDQQPTTRRRPTTDSLLSNVERRPTVGRRTSNVALTQNII